MRFSTEIPLTNCVTSARDSTEQSGACSARSLRHLRLAARFDVRNGKLLEITDSRDSSTVGNLVRTLGGSTEPVFSHLVVTMFDSFACEIVCYDFRKSIYHLYVNGQTFGTLRRGRDEDSVASSSFWQRVRNTLSPKHRWTLRTANQLLYCI